MRAPSVSVIMPVFNAGIFLRTAVESVLTQTNADLELLAIDDGSTDGSREWLRMQSDSRLRLFENPANLGPATTRNRALAEAKGGFIAFLNHDDAAAPDRLERQTAYLRNNPAVKLVGGALRVRDAVTGRDSLWTGPATDEQIRWRGLLDCPMRLSTVMIRRDVLEKHRLLFDPAWPVHADYEWVMRSVRVALAANLPDTLATAHRHAGSLSIRRADALHEAAARIAYVAIRAELPDFPIDLATVAGLRTVLASAPGERRTLAFTKQMMDVHLRLLTAFHAKYPGMKGAPVITANHG